MMKDRTAREVLGDIPSDRSRWLDLTLNRDQLKKVGSKFSDQIKLSLRSDATEFTGRELFKTLEDVIDIAMEDEVVAFFGSCELYEEEPEVIMCLAAKDKPSKKEKQRARRSAAQAKPQVAAAAEVKKEQAEDPIESTSDTAQTVSAVPFKVENEEVELETIDPDGDEHLYALLDEGCTNTLHFQRWETYAKPIIERHGQRLGDLDESKRTKVRGVGEGNSLGKRPIPMAVELNNGNAVRFTVKSLSLIHI